jgi:hypothetical protein
MSSETWCLCTDVGSQGSKVEIVREQESLVFGHVSSRNDMVVFTHYEDCCYTKLPARTHMHVKLRIEAPQRMGKCSGQYKRIVIQPPKELALW